MDRAYPLLVFDWDGTLMDSTITIVRCIQAACADLSLPVPDRATASHVIGLGLADALRITAPTLAPERVPELVERYRHHYLNQDHQLALFDGVREMLVALKEAGFSLAVATGKSRVGLNRALDVTGTRHFFEITRCADETFSKPHPAMLLEICNELYIEPAQTLMIGDTTHDLQMANNAKAAGVGVSYGAHPIAELLTCQPLTIVDHVPALQQWLLTHA